MEDTWRKLQQRHQLDTEKINQVCLQHGHQRAFIPSQPDEVEKRDSDALDAETKKEDEETMDQIPPELLDVLMQHRENAKNGFKKKVPIQMAYRPVVKLE